MLARGMPVLDKVMQMYDSKDVQSMNAFDHLISMQALLHQPALQKCFEREGNVANDVLIVCFLYFGNVKNERKPQNSFAVLVC